MLMPDALSRAKLARAARGLNAGALILMTDDIRLPDPCAAANLLPRGSLVIVRARDGRHRAMLGQQLRAIARRRGLVLLVAGDAALARAIGANGLHLPETMAAKAGRLRATNPGWLITVAAHSRAAIRRAVHADAVLLSPVFASESHKDATPLSAVRARLIARAARKPPEKKPEKAAGGGQGLVPFLMRGFR
jgi:thiamine-phosphate pyrophosphorylase